ncbi:MAG: aminomethyltransferase family protein [Pseudomonadales bacterium]
MSAVKKDFPMMQKTPFHERIAEACEANIWFDWKGYTCPDVYYDMELEYSAIRATTGVFDISPMTKYRISGPDAEAYLNRLVTRDVSKIKVGRVGYTVWCDEAGQVMDDGTIFHLAENDYRLCSYTKVMDWLQWSATGFDVTILDETDDVAALSIQGPTSCRILRAMGLDGLQDLKPFGITSFPFDGTELVVSRTGFTGDLGYELWIDPAHALALWDALFALSDDHVIKPVGGGAYELARIEAGFIQAGTDFVPVEETIRQGRSRSPLELGLSWLVDFKKPVFNGRKALLKEKEEGSRYRFVFLDIEGNKSAEHSFLYKGNKQVGTVTSAAWCPTSKSNFALAQVDAKYGEIGDEFIAEIYYERELQWTKVMATCTVVEASPFNPPRRRQTPAADI